MINGTNHFHEQSETATKIKHLNVQERDEKREAQATGGLKRVKLHFKSVLTKPVVYDCGYIHSLIL